MLTTAAIREYIAGLGIAADDNVYIGKMDGKKDKSIGVYSRPTNGGPFIAIGGLACTTYAIKSISLLVHWNKRAAESEVAAIELYQKFLNVSSLAIDGTHINYLHLLDPEPQDVGADDGGVYEFVIWLDFVYERTE